MHPLLHALTAIKLYPEDKELIIPAFAIDLKPLKLETHWELYRGEHNRTKKAIQITIMKLQNKLSQKEIMGVAVHLLGDLFWEKKIRHFLTKSFDFDTRRSVETTWAMKYLEQNFFDETAKAVSCLNENYHRIIKFIKKISGSNFDLEELKEEFQIIIGHFNSNEIHRILKSKIFKEYHNIMSQHFNFKEIIFFIKDNLNSPDLLQFASKK